MAVAATRSRAASSGAADLRQGARAHPVPRDATAQRAVAVPIAHPAETAMTIGRLAQAAEVSVETVRYYQRRGLLPQPAATRGAYRHYPPEVAARLRFIRRAQQLGFTLEEIASLLQLSDGTDRRSIRRITAARLAQLQQRMADMQKMTDVLQHLLHACEHAGGTTRCPIIESIGALPLATGHGTSA